MTAPLNMHIHTKLIEMVKEKLLLERIVLNGVDINVRDSKGRNALFWAIKTRSIHNANLLISFGSSLIVQNSAYKEHALFHAIAYKNHIILVLLMEKGLDVNMTDHIGKTLLMHAIESESFETVRYLIEKGADMYVLDDALNMAEDYAKDCHSELIQSYIKHIVCTDMNAMPYDAKLCKCG